MSFITFVVFTWLLVVIMLTLVNEYYEFYPYSRTHFDSHLLHANLLNKGQSSSSPYGNGNGGYEKNKQDGITILAYTAVLAAIIIPNMNQID